VNQDFKDLFRAFNDCGVRYLVVGAYAVIFYAEPRYTKDLDIWVEPSEENAGKVWEALASFGASLEGVTHEDFCNPELIYQIGVAPNRIDIMMGISGVDFSSAWQRRMQSTYGGEPIFIMHIDDLIKAKKAMGRDQDNLDLRRLEAVKNLIE